MKKSFLAMSIALLFCLPACECVKRCFRKNDCHTCPEKKHRSCSDNSCSRSHGKHMHDEEMSHK
ncbi:MAG: hypothetical protein WC707_01730 [Candidatus Babeliaceae bacterium]